MCSPYSPIITDATKDVFNDYINSLDIPQIDYFAIGVQNSVTKQSISLMSLPEWQKVFVANQFAEFDPVRRASLNTQRNIIPFNEMDFCDNFGKEIMKQRKLIGISDGIIFMKRFKKYNYIMTLGTAFSRFEAYEFIKRYYSQIQFLQKDLISLVEKDVRGFISPYLLTYPESIIQSSSDAK